MRYRHAASFRQALERRLRERAVGDGARLARDRKRVAFDRLLARLTVVAANRWLLKGGFALDLRMTERARATKDIDIDWRDPEDELLDTLLDAADHDAGDFFAFRVERAGPPEDRLGGSRRFRVSVSLAGREFETFPLDVGFRTDLTGEIDTLTTPDLLAFAGLAPVTCPRSRSRSKSPRRRTPTPAPTKVTGPAVAPSTLSISSWSPSFPRSTLRPCG